MFIFVYRVNPYDSFSFPISLFQAYVCDEKNTCTIADIYI